MPLVIATGAGASARKSIGITVFTGMIASTCLAVLFVPSLFVVIQRFEEWLKGRKKPQPRKPWRRSDAAFAPSRDGDKPPGNGHNSAKAAGRAAQARNWGRRMDRIWLKNYPAGVPTEIDTTQYASLVALLEESFAKFRDRKAFICMDKAITYGELDTMSRDFAAYLQSTGLKFGDRVAVMMPNVLQYPVATAGILRAGMTVVNVNPLYTPRELEHQLNDSGAEAIVILENFATTLEKVIKNTRVKHVILANMGDMLGFPKGAIVNLVVRKVKKMVPAYSLPQAVQFKAALAAGKGKPLNTRKISPDDVAFLQYTGGTTGVSKGATLLHRNIVANVLQNDAWLQPSLSKEPKVDQLLIVTALPLYHIFALTACFLLAMRAGGVCLLIPNPRDIPGFVKELQKYKVHKFPAVNTLYNALLNHPDFGKIDFSAAQDRGRRRHGGAARGRRALGEGDRLPAGRRLRAVGNLADADLHAGRHHRVHRHDRLAGALDRNLHPRR